MQNQVSQVASTSNIQNQGSDTSNSILLTGQAPSNQMNINDQTTADTVQLVTENNHQIQVSNPFTPHMIG